MGAAFLKKENCSLKAKQTWKGSTAKKKKGGTSLHEQTLGNLRKKQNKKKRK